MTPKLMIQILGFKRYDSRVVFVICMTSRAAEKGAGSKLPQGLELQGPHNTQHLKVWGAS